MTDEIETRRRRAIYRASHRGTKEMDHFIGRYADARVPGMDEQALDGFERFLLVPDPVLHAWFFASHGASASEFAVLVEDLRRYHGLDAARSTAGPK